MKSDSPNILFIMTDQQNWKALSAMGNPDLHTPNMDRLVREGTSFRNSYCASPVCGPSRMSLVTGLPPHEHKLTHHFFAPLHWKEWGLRSFGHQLQEAHYSTYWIGKWHAPAPVPKNADGTPGFTNLPAFPESESYRDGLGCDMDSSWAGRAVDFLKTPPEGPFFLGVSLLNPHDICYWIMNKHVDDVVRGVKTEGASLPPLPDNFEIDPDESEIVRYRRTVKKYGPEVQWTFEWSPEDWRKYLQIYYRLVEKVDRDIGRVLDALDASGLAENTLVVFTSDHGEGCASHRLVVKLSPYEEALRVPLVIRYPGRVPAGRVVDTQLASGLDLAPTFLDYAGAKPLPQARGISLKEVISGEKEQLRDFIVSELHPDILKPEIEGRILCTKDSKYMFATVGETVEEALYDLRNDPGEMHNLAARPESLSVLHEMRTRLGNWMRQTDDPLLKLFTPLETNVS